MQRKLNYILRHKKYGIKNLLGFIKILIIEFQSQIHRTILVSIIIIIEKISSHFCFRTFVTH